MRACTLLLAVVLGVASCRRSSPPKPFSAALPAYSPGSRFITVGDLQTTPFFERAESNDAERRLLVRAIAAEKPSFLALTGDLVDDGSNAGEWAELDDLMSPIRDAGIPALAAFGNHEYAGSRAGEAKLFARVPAMGGKRFYVVPRGPLRLVVLDSNVLVLSAAEWTEQRRWYEQTLSALDADETVRGIMVLLHHEPFTNSTLTDDEGHVQRDFVPAFLSARKTLAMLSGHVHSYERFQRQGKSFVVSGGGGGPRVVLSTGSARRHADDLFSGPPLRDFHFGVYTLEDHGISVEMRGLEKGGSVFRTMDRFTLPYAN